MPPYRNPVARHRCALTLAPIVLACLFLAAAAQARTETLRWQDPNSGGVAGYKIHFGTQPGQHPNVTDVGLLPMPGGIATYDLEVPDDATVYVTVTAYDDSDVESAKSNEGQRTPPPVAPEPLGRPGRPEVVWPASAGGANP